MKVITEKLELQKTLKKLSPSRIAVAYIGAGWRKYIDPQHLHDLVVSPTLGSNPNAIHDIANTIGWDKVHFLDQLHSKIYLSDGKAMVGSANLSDNALAQGNLSEVMILLKKKKTLTTLGGEIDSYIKAAKKRYPNKKAKIARLNRLETEWEKAVWNDLAKTSEETSEIGVLSDDQLTRIHIAWYIHGDLEFNIKELGTKVAAKSQEEIEKYYSDYANFHEGDEIAEGDWLLFWHSKQDGLPYKNRAAYWMQAQEITPLGIVDDTYTKLVAEIEKHTRPSPPFSLDDLQDDIRELLASKKYPSLLSLNDETWKLKPTKLDTKLFLSELRKRQLVKNEY